MKLIVIWILIALFAVGVHAALMKIDPPPSNINLIEMT